MKKSIGDLGEFGLIQALTGKLKSADGVVQGIGDDCAIIESGGKQLLLTCDASLEDVHFKRTWGCPEDLGWKAAVSALSDIAAMGGRATAALVTLGIPTDISVDFVEGLYTGIASAVASAGASIVGGDTTVSRSGIVLDLTIIGEVAGRALLRSGAKPGDLLAVAGAIGERGAGLHALLNGVEAPDLVRAYVHPSPRIAAGLWLQAQPEVRAMMDISDALLMDARHMATASGVAIDLRTNDLPPHEGLTKFWGGQEMDCAQMRMRSGEEYELLIALEPSQAIILAERFTHEIGLPLHIVGACSAGEAHVTIDGHTPTRMGFEHFRS